MAEHIDPAAGAAAHDRPITYFVNAEPEETTEHVLTGRAILEAAGFTPVGEYSLTRNAGNKAVGLDEDVAIHKGEAFTATFNGPTPTS